MHRALTAVCLLVAACSPSGSLPTVPAEPTTSSTAFVTTEPTMTSTTSTAPTTTTVPTTTTTTLPALEALAYEEIAPMPFPIQLTALPGSPLSYVATKDGRVWVFDGSEVLPDAVLDIRDQVLNQGERGLLSIALHPEDETRFYAHYTANDGDTVVSEFSFTADGVIDPASERILLRLNQPASNHNGGMIQFGPQGSLFVGLGDGGGSNDRFGNGQNTDTLLGGLVEISVEGDPSPRLYSHGLRNPWRFWIEEGVIYVADVGQNRYEEVTVTSMVPGINFGWPITEGQHCFRPSSGCDTEGLTLPQLEVSHGDGGTCSITGGVVYRGREIPELAGHYFYSDYCGGYLRSFVFAGGEIIDEADWTAEVGIPGRIAGFGVDGAGEMYVMTTTHLLRVAPVRD
ncbi:MAG: PQQ-dependent sugar dehydrogenase [Acidimicrobiia bacterium]|nr:PQQ-dependent sugar dehydrogenase [Acidimicrobiia bacterium]